MKIIGSAEDAAALKTELLLTIKSLNDETSSIWKKYVALRNSFKDDGREQVEDIIKGVHLSLSQKLDSISYMVSVLKKYEELLSKGESARDRFVNQYRVAVSGTVQMGAATAVTSANADVGMEPRERILADERVQLVGDSWDPNGGKNFRVLLSKLKIHSSEIVQEPNKDGKVRRMPFVESYEPVVDIVPLQVTKQVVVVVPKKNGGEEEVFDHPQLLAVRLPYVQGINQRSKKGTCGLADTAVWLSIAGSIHNENDVVNFAATHINGRGKALCSKSGGTYPEDRALVWEGFGIPADVFRVKNNECDSLIERIAEAVENGRAVGIGLNAGRLWAADNAEGRNYVGSYGDGGSNHVVGVVSVVRDKQSGKITDFYINDTGRGFKRDACRRVPLADFKKAFEVRRASACISRSAVW